VSDLEKALLETQQMVADKKAELAVVDAELARLRALEMSLANAIRIRDTDRAEVTP
jgi:hypothetical protein